MLCNFIIAPNHQGTRRCIILFDGNTWMKLTLLTNGSDVCQNFVIKTKNSYLSKLRNRSWVWVVDSFLSLVHKVNIAQAKIYFYTLMVIKFASCLHFNQTASFLWFWGCMEINVILLVKQTMGGPSKFFFGKSWAFGPTSGPPLPSP